MDNREEFESSYSRGNSLTECAVYDKDRDAYIPVEGYLTCDDKHDASWWRYRFDSQQGAYVGWKLGIAAKKAKTDADIANYKARIEEVSNLALDLAQKVNAYRNLHDLKGGGSIEAGRAWDQMSRAEHKILDAIQSAKESE